MSLPAPGRAVLRAGIAAPALAGLLAGLVVATAGARAQCCDPVPFLENGWFSANAFAAFPVWIGATDSGIVQCVWSETRQPVLYTSRDGGRTFGLPQTAMTEFSNEFGFGLAPDGTLLVAYESAGMFWVRRSTDDGVRWSLPVPLIAATMPSIFPHDPVASFEIRPNGLVALLVLTGPNDPYEHAVFVSPDLGQTWSAAVTGTSPFPWDPQIAASDTSVTYAYSSGTEILTRRTTDAGRTWSAPVAANSVPLGTAKYHAVATTEDGAVQVAYSAATASPWQEIHVAVSTDDGVSWNPANDSSVGESTFAGDDDLFLLPLPGARLIVGGWLDRAGAPGVATNFSSSRGLPGTWLAAPSCFAVAGVAQHDWNLAALPDGTALVVHDDYRLDRVGLCTSSSTSCESIFMSRACAGTTTWDEFRLDDDTPPRPAHSEEAQIALTSTGRLHVLFINGDSVSGIVELKTMAVTPPQDLPVTVTVDRAPDCLSATQELSIDPNVLFACASPSIAWFLDDVVIPGATATTYQPSPSDVDGVHAWHAEITCGAGCDFRTEDIALQPYVPPALPTIARTDIPAGTCSGGGAILTAVPLPPGECMGASYQWYVDGARIFGAWNDQLLATAPDFAPGVHAFSYIVTCTPARPCGDTSPDEMVTIGAFTPPTLAMTRTDLTASGCQPDRTLLEAVPPDPATCITPTYQWLMDGGRIGGATGASLLVSGRSFPAGLHDFQYVLSCGAGASCPDPSPPESVQVQGFTVVPPLDVGPALFATAHGDPHAPDATATFEWTGDRGLPRTAEHYHVMRGTEPWALALASEFEPLASMTVVDSTPAATSLPLVHFYSILAANACEDVSLD